jgi:hypothetical protein
MNFLSSPVVANVIRIDGGSIVKKYLINFRAFIRMFVDWNFF